MNRLSRLALVTLTLAALAVPAGALTVVNTSAPLVNCAFSPTCSVVVTDMASPILNGGFVQSRIFQGQAGTQTAGKWIYEYRIDLRNAVGIVNVPYVTSMSMNFGTLESHDYNFDGIYTDQVFVVTSGGLGTIGLSSSSWFWNFAGFNFSSAIYAGGSPGQGESSYFFGLVSPYPPHTINATVQTDSGSLSVPVYAPNHP